MRIIKILQQIQDKKITIKEGIILLDDLYKYRLYQKKYYKTTLKPRRILKRLGGEK